MKPFPLLSSDAIWQYLHVANIASDLSPTEYKANANANAAILSIGPEEQILVKSESNIIIFIQQNAVVNGICKMATIWYNSHE